MIRTMQDLLNAGVNAFALRLLAKDFGKMTGAASEPVHIPFPMADGKTVWITISSNAPTEAQESARNQRT